MAKKLVDIHAAILKEGGASAQMRLAMKTGMTTAKAATEPDTPDNVKKMQNAYKEITGKPCPIT